MAIQETPMMKQFNEMKIQHPDALLLFRCGDFYETYSTDAIKASEVLGITLTKRSNGGAAKTEMAGFPYHALDTYLPKLVRAGLRVAICDQLEDPKKTKKLVKRGITELITPGVSINDNVLNYKENNFLAAVNIDVGANSNSPVNIGVSFLDISTGEFLVAQGNADYIEKLMNNFQPKEVLHDRNKREVFNRLFGRDKYLTYEQEDWIYTSDAANDKLLKHFDTRNLKGFGVENLKVGIIASGAILYYLDHTHHTQISHITSLSRIEEDNYVWLDRFTIRNLELYNNGQDGQVSLLNVIDKTTSPMGARMLKRWLSFPLKSVKAIERRHRIVEYLKNHKLQKETLTEQFAMLGDVERITSKIAVGRVSPRELGQLRIALKTIEKIKAEISEYDSEDIKAMAERINPCHTVIERLERELSDDPPAVLSKGGVIKKGFNSELDDLRDIAFNGKDYISRMEQRESEMTGIPSLKIGYNNVFGYYLEVRNTYKGQVPETWVRKQTLVNAERYITQELKEYEDKILGAQEKIDDLEQTLYRELVESLGEYIPAFQLDCNVVSETDCYLSFAGVAESNNYVRPEIDDSLVIDIKGGRHPVIETQLPLDEPYIANDVYLDSETQQIMMITGPNMAGKSALLRQTALIVLLAQIGSFVPADKARIGIVDKIFTRVGASDNISNGESTFMVEMNEAASILNNISERSLVLFDELGRGTSTYDGISIAWAIVEYIHENKQARAKTLFATHYHELNEMEKSYARIKNYNVKVNEVGNKVVFMRKLEPGGSEHSFGIHVAKMAGMPQSIVNRANDILIQLESDNSHGKGETEAKIQPQQEKKEAGYQLSIFQLDDPVLKMVRDEIINTDINNLTPIQALNKLSEIKKIVTGKE